MAQEPAQLAARDTSGPLSQLHTNLGDVNGQEWLDALKKFLRKENAWPRRAKEYHPWKKITVDGRNSIDQWRSLLKEKRISLDGSLAGFAEPRLISREKIDVELVKLYVSELGFTTSVFYRDVIKKAESLNFFLCSVELAFALRLDYIDQPANEHLYVPIAPHINEWSLDSGPHGTVNGTTIDLNHMRTEPEEAEDQQLHDELRLTILTEWAHNQNWYPTNKLVLAKPRS